MRATSSRRPGGGGRASTAGASGSTSAVWRDAAAADSGSSSAARLRGRGAELPWRVVDGLVSPEFLGDERERSLHGRDDRRTAATGAAPPAASVATTSRWSCSRELVAGQVRAPRSGCATSRTSTRRARCSARFARAGVVLALSQGMRPKPRISVVVPLPVGAAAADELVVVEVDDELTALDAARGPAGAARGGAPVVSRSRRSPSSSQRPRPVATRRDLPLSRRPRRRRRGRRRPRSRPPRRYRSSAGRRRA